MTPIAISSAIIAAIVSALVLPGTATIQCRPEHTLVHGFQFFERKRADPTASIMARLPKRE